MDRVDTAAEGFFSFLDDDSMFKDSLGWGVTWGLERTGLAWMDLDSTGSENTGQAPAGPASGKDVYICFVLGFCFSLFFM